MAGKFFLERVADDSTDTLQAKNLIEIALPCTVSKINVFLRFMKFKMAVKNGGKPIF